MSSKLERFTLLQTLRLITEKEFAAMPQNGGHPNIQHNDPRHNDPQHKNLQHNNHQHINLRHNDTQNYGT